MSEPYRGEEVRWVIVYRKGLYVGQWLTRKDAIAEHTRDLGKAWAKCRANGDRAMKVVIRWGP